MQDRKKDTDVKSIFLDSVGEGESGMIWENSIENVYYHIWNRSPVQVWCMRQGAQGWCTGMTRGMGWQERWEGFQDGEHMYTHGWFMSMYGKNHHNTVISLQLK